MSDDDLSLREKLALLAVGAKPDKERDTEPVGDAFQATEAFIPFDELEHVYVDHDGTRYEIVATDDGLAVEVADE